MSKIELARKYLKHLNDIIKIDWLDDSYYPERFRGRERKHIIWKGEDWVRAYATDISSHNGDPYNSISENLLFERFENVILPELETRLKNKIYDDIIAEENKKRLEEVERRIKEL